MLVEMPVYVLVPTDLLIVNRPVRVDPDDLDWNPLHYTPIRVAAGLVVLDGHRRLASAKRANVTHLLVQVI